MNAKQRALDIAITAINIQIDSSLERGNFAIHAELLEIRHALRLTYKHNADKRRKELENEQG